MALVLDTFGRLASRAAGRLRDLDKPDEELKKMIGPWSLSRAWRDS